MKRLLLTLTLAAAGCTSVPQQFILDQQAYQNKVGPKMRYYLAADPALISPGPGQASRNDWNALLDAEDEVIARAISASLGVK